MVLLTVTLPRARLATQVGYKHHAEPAAPVPRASTSLALAGQFLVLGAVEVAGVPPGRHADGWLWRSQRRGTRAGGRRLLIQICCGSATATQTGVPRDATPFASMLRDVPCGEELHFLDSDWRPLVGGCLPEAAECCPTALAY